jgi:hypothetical protein
MAAEYKNLIHPACHLDLFGSSFSPPNVWLESIDSGLRPTGLPRGQMTSQTYLQIGQTNVGDPSEMPSILVDPPLQSESGFMASLAAQIPLRAVQVIWGWRLSNDATRM